MNRASSCPPISLRKSLINEEKESLKILIFLKLLYIVLIQKFHALNPNLINLFSQLMNSSIQILKLNPNY